MKKYLTILFLLGVLVYGCTQQTIIKETSAPQQQTTEGSLADSATVTVEIKDFAFNPATITIKKGTTVTWTNQDSAPHTVTSESGNELDSPTLSKGQSYSHTFNEVGTFSYYCTIHPRIKGNVVVE